ncbi:uncharacterized protein LOC108733119 [Agrilus planipennis]|uniref:Uncharacterized protein LOC108733119 n=1 Tax=Agrilus planipennis TaxID=224129 RepID=A0A1W4WI26_AGRPL|nr:uncharacterized protein LOC108733119 [Agrilus planipennis]
MADVNKEENFINGKNDMDIAVYSLISENTTTLSSHKEDNMEIENVNSLKNEVIEFHNSLSETTDSNAVVGNAEGNQEVTAEDIKLPIQVKCEKVEKKEYNVDDASNLNNAVIKNAEDNQDLMVDIKLPIQVKCEKTEVEKSDVDKASNLKSEPFVKLQFRNAEAYEQLSEILLTLLTTMGFTFKEEKLNFSIDFFETESINNSPDLDKLKISKKKKRKRKKSKDEGDGFFVLDTTPSLTTQREKILKYESKFNIQNVTEKNDENASDSTLCVSAANSCFNCSENHNLKDCPLPRDNAKINHARLKFRNTPKNGRYHLEDDQKYSHLKPGQLTDNLRKALGLHRDQLPDYIYRMRRLGYPPGWLEEAQIVHSDLTVYDFDGKNVITNKKTRPFVDPEKIIDYPGFNVPLDKGFRDEFRDFGVPPYSEKFSKEVMLQHIKILEEREQDNLNTEDMEFESIMPEEDLSPVKDMIVNSIEKEIELPSLTELESKKNQLLAELNDNTNGSTTSGITVDEISSEDNRMPVGKEKEVTIEMRMRKITNVSVSENGKITHHTLEEPTESISMEMIGRRSISGITSLSQTETISSSQTETTSSSQAETTSSSQAETTSSSQAETTSSSQAVHKLRRQAVRKLRRQAVHKLRRQAVRKLRRQVVRKLRRQIVRKLKLR